ncbi:MAG: hypothetical protein LBB94_11545 [Clostridiales bacterium]|jgi:hypothetical protein|nr:hypothetical protein [Clostridiales bacterium]
MDKLRFYITIIACLIVTAAGIIQNTPIYELSFRLIIAIVIFYIIGSLLEKHLKKNGFFNDNLNEAETLAQENEDEGNNL